MLGFPPSAMHLHTDWRVKKILSSLSLWGAVFGNKIRTPNNETALKHSFLSSRNFYLLLLFAEGKGEVVNILRVSLCTVFTLPNVTLRTALWRKKFQPTISSEKLEI